MTMTAVFLPCTVELKARTYTQIRLVRSKHFLDWLQGFSFSTPEPLRALKLSVVSLMLRLRGFS